MATILPLTLKLDGYKIFEVGSVIEDVPLPGMGDGTFDLVEICREGESGVEAGVMDTRAKEIGGLTGEDCAHLFMNHMTNIPFGWRYFTLIFPGTKRRNFPGVPHIPSLQWFGDQWRLVWRPFGYSSFAPYDCYDRIVRLRG